MDGGISSNTSRPQGRTRRPRAARACDLCRTKKNKCDESYPCSYCRTRDVPCVFQGQVPNSRRLTAEYVKQLEDRVKQLSAQAKSPHAAPLDHFNHYSPPDNNGYRPHQQQHQQQQQPRNEGHHDSANTARTRQTGEEEVSGVNRHTRDVEFYGSSSSFALLSHIQNTDQRPRGDEDAAHLVSSLHNTAFRTSPNAVSEDVLDAQAGRAPFFPQCHRFLESYFSTIHYVHPVLDRNEFMEKAERLISSDPNAANGDLTASFVALYYSVLSLGAIVGVRDENQIEGLSNLQWSRRLFDIARSRCNQLGLVTDLEMVQLYFMMAKVCQNELNSHWSYMYVGLAVRTALAMGMNRDPGSDTKKSAAQLRAESRTWWGLYSLETEISFSLGRPDTLGADIYHNRALPLIHSDAQEMSSRDRSLLEPPHCLIIISMVDFSRITRSICQRIYLSNTSISDMVLLSNQIEEDLDAWVDVLPMEIRPSTQRQGHLQSKLKSAKAAQWARRQKLVLNIRYHNVKILLFGSLLLRSSPLERDSVPGCQDNIRKCLDSAKQTISIIYHTYEHSEFFHTWFYNTTYTVFAASVILLYVTRGSVSQDEARSLLDMVSMAVEILEIMDECVVALEAAKLLRRAQEKAEMRISLDNGNACSQQQMGNVVPEADAITPLFNHVQGQSVQLNHYWGPLGLIDGSGIDFDIATQLGAFDHNNPMFLALGDQ